MPIEENVDLKQFSSYKIGGSARYIIRARRETEIIKGINFSKQKNIPFFVLGGGTNLLISDSGFPGIIIKVEISELEINKDVITVGAGAQMKDLLDFSVKHHLSGLEWAGGLPGTLGGAVRGNAGAFGGEIKDNLLSVRSVKFNQNDLEIVERTNTECLFGYRNSIFKNDAIKEIIISAKFKLKLGSSEDIKKAIDEKILYRQTKHPLESPNIGSIFKNIPFESLPDEWKKFYEPRVKKDPMPVVPTAILISDAGLNGKTIGGAQISEKHSNFIVNLGNAKAQDISDLIEIIKQKIKEKFGVVLEEEVIRLGFRV